MKKPIWLWILWGVLVTACSVMPKPVKQAALPDMPFPGARNPDGCRAGPPGFWPETQVQRSFQRQAYVEFQIE